MNAIAEKRTGAQNRAIHMKATELAGLSQLDPELVPSDVNAMAEEGLKLKWLRYLCLQVSGQEHSSELTPAQARKWLTLADEHLADLRAGLTGVKKERAAATIPPKMQDHIEKLLKAIADLHGRYAQMAGSRLKMRRFCEVYIKQPWPQTMQQADTLLEALKSILWRSLPSKQVLDGELDTLRTLPHLISDFGAALVADAADPKRKERWGPLQWYWLNRVFLETLLKEKEHVSQNQG